MKYATSLVNYRDSRINLYQNIKDQLNALLTSNNNFNTNLTTFTNNVNTFVTSTQTLNTLVTNAINGFTGSAGLMPAKSSSPDVRAASFVVASSTIATTNRSMRGAESWAGNA